MRWQSLLVVTVLQWACTRVLMPWQGLLLLLMPDCLLQSKVLVQQRLVVRPSPCGCWAAKRLLLTGVQQLLLSLLLL